jgi:hypothetical protein
MGDCPTKYLKTKIRYTYKAETASGIAGLQVANNKNKPLKSNT